jgi:hypothetical protein
VAAKPFTTRKMPTEMELDEKMDAWIADMKDGCKERTPCQKTMEAIQRRWNQIQEKGSRCGEAGES